MTVHLKSVNLLREIIFFLCRHSNHGYYDQFTHYTIKAVPFPSCDLLLKFNWIHPTTNILPYYSALHYLCFIYDKYVYLISLQHYPMECSLDTCIHIGIRKTSRLTRSYIKLLVPALRVVSISVRALQWTGYLFCKSIQSSENTKNVCSNKSKYQRPVATLRIIRTNNQQNEWYQAFAAK